MNRAQSKTLARGRELGALCYAWGLNSATKHSDWGHGTSVTCTVAPPISFRSVLGERLVLVTVFCFCRVGCKTWAPFVISEPPGELDKVCRLLRPAHERGAKGQA